MEVSRFPFAGAGDRQLSCRLHDGRTVQGRLFVLDGTSQCLVLIRSPAQADSAATSEDYTLINTRHIRSIDYAEADKELTLKPRTTVLDQTVRIAVPATTPAPSPRRGKSRSPSRSPAKRAVVVPGQENYSSADRDRAPKLSAESPQARRADAAAAATAAGRVGSPKPAISPELRTMHDALIRHLPVKYGSDGFTLLLGDELRLVPPYTSDNVRTSARTHNLGAEERARREAALQRVKRLIDTERAVLFPRGAAPFAAAAITQAGTRTGTSAGGAWKQRRKEPPTRGG